MITNVFVLSSPPGAGKTTLSHQLKEQYNAIRYSFDELHCFKHSDLIPPIIESINNGNSVIVDALYSEARFRKELLQAISSIPCKKICIVLLTPLEECLKRNANREARLPDFVLHDLYNKFELPTLDEGWDDIWYYK